MNQCHRVLPDRPRESLQEHLDAGGGAALDAARSLEPTDIIAEVGRSGLRGRGGAGFPTGRKWVSVAAAATGREPVVVNAAEGEPGTFKDRQILRTNPYLVVEGALVAARAMGASEVIVATKASFTHERARLSAALAEVRAAGWLDGIDVRLITGPSEYLFGEETAMLEVIEGRPPFPRVAPPYRQGLGAEGPILVDNVETLADVALVVGRGADWFRTVGTAESPGTVVCTVTGSTVRHAVGEYPMGTPLRTVIDELGGGVAPGRSIVAVLPGVSAPAVAAADLDVPLTYEDLAAVGSGLGSAGFIVIDDAVDRRDLAAQVARFLAVESCGQCEPCKRDALALHAALAADAPLDRGAVADRLRTVAQGARCALARQTEGLVGSLAALVGESSVPVPTEPVVLPMVDLVEGRARLDTGHLAKQPDWTYDDIDSGAWPAQRLEDQPVEAPSSRTHEAAGTGASAEQVPEGSGPPDPFASLVALHRRIEGAVTQVASRPPGGRAAAAQDLAILLDLHLEVARRFLYPAAARADDLDGDVAFYPERHEEQAIALLDRVRRTDHEVAEQALTDLADEVRRSIDEIEVRLLPLVARRTEPHDLAELGAGIDDLLEPQAP